MTNSPDQLKACREAFEKWCGEVVPGSTPHPLLWRVWNAAIAWQTCNWNTRHAQDDGAVAWLEVEPGVSLEQATSEHGVLIHSMRVHVGRHQPTKAQEPNGLFPLYSHPPRSVDEAMDAAVEKMRREMIRYLPVLEALAEDPDVWGMATEGTGIATLNGYKAAIDAAMAARGGE